MTVLVGLGMLSIVLGVGGLFFYIYLASLENKSYQRKEEIEEDEDEIYSLEELFHQTYGHYLGNGKDPQEAFRLTINFINQLED